MNDAFGAGCNRRTCEHAVVIHVRIENVNAGKSLELRNVELGLRRMAAERLLVVHDLAAGDVADVAQIRRAEGGDIRRIGLCHVAGVVDHVVHGNENALADGLLIDGNAYGIQKIHRAVGRNRRSRTHGAHEDDGLVASHREIQEVGRLLERIRAVRDHDAVNVLLRQELVAALRELQERRRIHVVGRNLHDLLARHVGNFLDLRDGVDKRLNGDLARFITRRLGGGRCAPGDRAARRKDLHVGKVCSGGRDGCEENSGRKCGFFEEIHSVSFGGGVPGLLRKPVGRESPVSPVQQYAIKPARLRIARINTQKTKKSRSFSMARPEDRD